jgi:hypothetical protein
MSTPVTQVLPPNGSVGGFDISFSSDYVQEFVGQIVIEVNGSNMFTVNVKAEVIPISLGLNKNELALSFSSSNTTRFAVIFF